MAWNMNLRARLARLEQSEPGDPVTVRFLRPVVRPGPEGPEPVGRILERIALPGGSYRIEEHTKGGA